MPPVPMSGFGAPPLLMSIMVLLGLVFVAVLFILAGFEMQWRFRSTLLLILLVISSGLIGLALMYFASVASLGFMEEITPREVSLGEATNSADFKVYVPKHLPRGMKFSAAQLIPEPGANALTLQYSGSGEDLQIMESKEWDMAGPAEEGAPGPKPRELKIKGATARLLSQSGEPSFLFIKLDGVSINIETTLPESEIIKVAKSLERQ